MGNPFQRANRLNPGSYKGVPFLVPDERVERGQKLKVHEYPNSDERYAEPLGKFPSIIDLTCIVHTEEFFDNRERLETALEEPGPGKLVHPIYGPITVQPGKYTISSNQTRIGEFVFNVKFYASKVVVPSPAFVPTIRSFVVLANASNSDALDEINEEPKDGAQLDSDEGSFSDTLDSFADAAKDIVQAIEAGAAEMNSVITTARNNVYNVLQTAQGLKDTFTNLTNTFKQLTLDPSSLKSAWTNLSTTGTGDDGEVESNPTTTDSRRRNEQNRSSMAEYSRITGLIGLFESISDTDFNTADELTLSMNEADELYSKLFESEIVNSDITQLSENQDLRDAIAALRIATKAITQNKLNTTWKIDSIDSGLTSMSLLSYKFYKNIDNIDIISGLNRSISVSNFDGNINIITK
jgi:prophage DNA circulation protein